MSNMAALFDVLKNHSDDVEEVVRQMGGIGNVIRASPALIKIGMVIAKHKEPEQAAEHVERMLYYNDETRAKVEEFQRKHGLKADGIVGNATWRALEGALKK